MTTRIPALPPGYVLPVAVSQRFDEHRDRKLILVAAPAGYGKTCALAAHALALRERAVSWLSASPEVDDPRRFVAALVSALRHASTVEPGALDTLMDADASPRDAAHLLINAAIRFSRRTVIFIDGFDHVRDAQVHDLVHLLVGRSPPTWQFVIASRTVPPLELAQWRVQGQSGQIGAAALALGPDEALRVLRDVCGVAASSDTAAILSDRLRGWAEGIVLAGRLAVRAADPDAALRSFSGAQDPVVDYVKREVVDRLNVPARQFLLDIAPLVRLSAELCADVLGDPTAARVLRDLAAEQTFLSPVDGPDGWFELDHTFREALGVLSERAAPRRKVTTYERAHTWCLEHNLLCDAAEYAIRAAGGDVQTVADRLEADSEALVDECPSQQVARWLCELSASSLDQRPALRLLAARSALESGDLDTADTHIGALTATRDVDAGCVDARFGLISARIDLRLRQLRLDRALTLARQLRRAAAGTPDQRERAAARDRAALSAARAFWLAGQPQQAVAVLTLLDSQESTLPRRIERAGLHGLITWGRGGTRAAQSDADVVTRLVAHASVVTRSRSAPYGALVALWSEADLDLAWVHDCMWSADAHAPPDLACVQELIAAELARRSGRVDASRAALARASSAARSFRQVTALADLVAHQTHRCDTLEVGPIELSPSERAVLTLLPTRLTNRQIADRLYLSHNTVKSHLRTLYRKLGVSSRSAAIARAEDAVSFKPGSDDEL